MEVVVMPQVYKIGWMDDGSLAIFVPTTMGAVMVLSFSDISEYNSFLEQAAAFRAKIADVGIPRIFVDGVNK